jgi:transposase
MDAEIFFGDEAGVRSEFHSGKTWAPKGQTPVIKTTRARLGFNMVSAVTPKAKMRYMVVRERVAAKQFCDLLCRLLFRAQRPMFLILEGHPVHRSAKVKHLVESIGDKLQLFFLPLYSPELNPDESVWDELKNNGIPPMLVLQR